MTHPAWRIVGYACIAAAGVVMAWSGMSTLAAVQLVGSSIGVGALVLLGVETSKPSIKTPDPRDPGIEN